MTEPQHDRTGEDELAERTDNGLRPGDPPEDQQPPQDPAWLPPGTVTGEDQ